MRQSSEWGIRALQYSLTRFKYRFLSKENGER